MKSLYCSFFGHQYEVSKNVTYHVKEYKCSHCNTQVTTSGNGHLTPLTPKYKEINSVLSRIHNRRVARIKQNGNLKTHEDVILNFTPHFS
ncbi:hypothetical protein ES692_06535 [Psychroserpens burtonensis]|uniref:Uncharacterized protein n=1 Tax=Psychroserpens burtonensis TaxID=49278 RepID=A0A5C7B7U0_9FLAO|nr:hypothetical protein [Psychroserpens burtonensis]TXE18301.1 hypothetical protein ES692_06535 [Psychroserpens burtonensis]